MACRACWKFAKNNLQFSTDPNPTKSKTKCIFVCCQARKSLWYWKARNFPGLSLPYIWAISCMSLVLWSRMSRSRGQLSSRRVLGFGFACPTEVFYVGSHYGSNLWQLDSQMARQYFSAWPGSYVEGLVPTLWTTFSLVT